MKISLNFTNTLETACVLSILARVALLSSRLMLTVYSHLQSKKPLDSYESNGFKGFNRSNDLVDSAFED